MRSIRDIEDSMEHHVPVSRTAGERQVILSHINSVREEMTRRLQLEMKYQLITKTRG